MINEVSFEWFKLSRRWMPRIVLILLIGLTVLAFWGYSTRALGRPNLFLPRGWLAALSFSAFFAPFFWPVLGGSWAGNEYGWGTIRSILTRRPERLTHALAALCVLIVGVLIGIVAIVAVGTVASAGVSIANGTGIWTSGLFTGAFAGALLKGILTTWYVSAFYLLLAYAAAIIARSAAVGIGFGIGATLAQVVLHNLFTSLGGVWQTIADHFPFNYSESMITQVVHSSLVQGTNLARVDPGTPSAGSSLIALAIYAAILLAAMLTALRLRDVTA
jgi:hypothetical protein